MEDEDDLGPHVAQLNALLKQLPKYRRAVVCDLFHLFSCIVAFQQFNFMNSENVATIFGGMTDIMTSLMTGTQRSRLVRIMIDNFVAVFDGVYELETRVDEPVGKETKEGIRVYLHDGTFKSLFCQSTEPCKEIHKKAIAKIQQTADIDPSNYHLYEIRDAMWRLIGENERVLPIIKSGSALLITDRLKGEKSEKPAPCAPITASTPTSPVLSSASNTSAPLSPGPTSSNTTTTSNGTDSALLSATSTSTTKPTSKSGRSSSSSKRDKSPRSDSTTPPPSATGTGPTIPTLSIKKELSRESISRPSPRESILPPIAFTTSSQMLLWIFPRIPVGSMKATEWDPNTTLEGQAELRCSPSGSSVSISAGDMKRTFTPSQMSSVDDSTRYFVMGSTTKRIGLGFETRDEAAKFKVALQQMLQWDQLHALDLGTPATLASVTQFAIGPLGFDQKMEDGFFDLATIPTATTSGSATAPVTLRELSQSPIDVKTPEILLVNKNQDVRLERFVQVAEKLVPPGADIEERAKALALFVSNVFGGIDISDGVGSIEDHLDTPYASLEGISKDSIISLRTRTKSNIVKLGNVTHGVRRHRSLLFKYIADRLEPVLPAALARTTPALPGKYSAYGILIPYPSSMEAYAYVDLVNEPGFAYPFDSPVTTSFTQHMFGRIPAPSSAFASRLELSHKDVDNAWYLHKNISHPPQLSEQSITRVYEQIGCSATSRVYRGAMGPIPVAIKEILLDTPAASEDSLSSLIDSQCGIASHEHIAATFGSQIENGVMRIFREYLGLRSLADQARIAHSKAQPFDEAGIWRITHEIVSGIKYLHSLNKVHGNLSASNVLLDGDGKLQNFTTVKLSDPLLTQSRSPASAHNDSYRAPETLKDNAPSKPADIWSLGVIIAELATDRFFHTADNFQAALADAEAEFGPFAHIVTQCCHADPSQRLDIAAMVDQAQEALFPPVPPSPGK